MGRASENLPTEALSGKPLKDKEMGSWHHTLEWRGVCARQKGGVQAKADTFPTSELHS